MRAVEVRCPVPVCRAFTGGDGKLLGVAQGTTGAAWYTCGRCGAILRYDFDTGETSIVRRPNPVKTDKLEALLRERAREDTAQRAYGYGSKLC